MKKKTVISVFCFFAGMTAVAFASRGYLRPQTGPILPAMTEPPEGPRGPDNSALGVKIGLTGFKALQAYVKDRNVDCVDTSAKALMKKMRAKKKAERESKVAAGQTVDAVSRASGKRKSPMERNPQIRFSCERILASQLDGRDDSVRGRALFVFDSPRHPLRHASFRRLHVDKSKGLQDARRTLANFEARFGQPHEVTYALPEDGASVETWRPYEMTWRWADMEAKVTVVDYGPRGFNVFESLQVPLPIRPDAPVR